MKLPNDNQFSVFDVGRLIDEPAEAYHAKAGEFLTSHQVLDFRRCPLLYMKRARGLIPNTESPAFLLGRAAHARILEGSQAFQMQFALGGPVNPRTGRPFGPDTQAFRAWADTQAKPTLTHEQVDLIERMSAGVASNSRAVDLLAAGRAEGVVRTAYAGEACQARLDWVHPRHGIVDLKTCDDLTWYEADARRYGYAHQLAFYRAVLALALGLKPLDIPVHMIAIEKKEPFRAGVWKLGEDVLATAQKENEEAIKRLRQCRDRDVWPTGYEEIRQFDWM